MAESLDGPTPTYAFQSAASNSERKSLSFDELSQEEQARINQMTDRGRRLSAFVLNLDLPESRDQIEVDFAS